LLLLVLAIYRIMSPGPALAVQIDSPPALLDPAGASSYAEKLIDSALYETLVVYDPEQHLCKGLLADEWDASQGGSIWTFHLRKGLRFHDGTQVTAQDVKASWERVLTPATGNCGYLLDNVVGSDGFVDSSAGDVSGLVAVDQYTLRVVLKEPDWTFPAVASSPSLAIVSQKAVARYGPAYGKKAGAVAGTGPFRLVAWDKDKLVLQRNTRYAGPLPQLKTLTFLAVSRPQEISSLYEAGMLDVLTEAPAQVLASLSCPSGPSPDGQADFTIFKKPVLNIYFLGFNLKQPPFNNLQMRRAISLAVDRSAIASQLLGNGANVLNGFLPPELTPGEQPEASQVKQDNGHALQAMAGAGYPYGLGLPQLSYAYNDSPGHDYLAQLLQDQLDKVGVDLQLKRIPWQDYETAIRSGSYSLFRLGWDADYPDPDNLLYFNFDSTEKTNLTGYDSAKFDALLQQARSEQDPGRRQEIYLQAEQTLLADAPIIPLFQQVAVFGLRKGIAGFDVDLLGQVDFAQLRKS
jgi:peptide/nickel transport system substrate-binding protein/oligopeptide transport system substrate-binding protein